MGRCREGGDGTGGRREAGEVDKAGREAGEGHADGEGIFERIDEGAKQWGGGGGGGDGWL